MTTIAEKADEIRSWLEDAVGDLAIEDPWDSEWKAKVEQARKAGCQDLKGWLADEYFNDVATLQDLVGDRIYDAATELCTTTLGVPEGRREHDLIFIKICRVMQETAHTALAQALDNLMARRQ